MGKEIRKQGAASIVAGGFFRFAIYACIVCAVFWAGKSAYDFGYAIFNQVPMESGEGTDVTVVIKEGSSVYQIGKILKKKNLIEDAKVFVIQEKLSNYEGQLQAGTYILNTSMTTDEMMAILARENVDGQPEQTIASGADESAEEQDTSEEEAEEGQTDESGQESSESEQEQSE